MTEVMQLLTVLVLLTMAIALSVDLMVGERRRRRHGEHEQTRP